MFQKDVIRPSSSSDRSQIQDHEHAPVQCKGCHSLLCRDPFCEECWQGIHAVVVKMTRPSLASLAANSRQTYIRSRLEDRNYPNLRMTIHIFENETHLSVIPATFSRGLREAFADHVKLSSTD